MGYPLRLLTEDEDIIREFHPHWRVLLPVVGWALLFGAAAWALVALAGIEAGWAVGATALVWLLVATPALVRWRFTQYVLTSERIVVRTGVVSRSGTEIPLENISNVLFSQSVGERLLGYGDVLVESAGSQGQSRLRDIPDPEAFQSEIYRAREARTLHFEGGGQPRDRAAQLAALADLRDRGVLTDDEFAAEKRRVLDA